MTQRCLPSITAQLAAVALLTFTLAAMVHADEKEKEKAEGEVRVGRLTYAEGKTGSCFAEGFLETVDRETDAKVKRTFVPVLADSEDLFKLPFVVWTGDGSFTLSDKEVENLRDYIKRGGFILASAGCSDSKWAASFQDAMRRILPDQSFKRIPMEHGIFHTLYEIEEVQPKRSVDDPHLDGITMGDRLAVVYSELGLNDTGNAGGGCCCCGGNEIRNARQINANILVYTLTR